MKKILSLGLSFVLVFALGFAAGRFLFLPGSAPDPCSLAQLPGTVAEYNSAFRAFEDTAQIALNLPRTEVIDPTMQLQALRRQVEDLPAPTCVAGLREGMLGYMDGVVNVLVGFIGGLSASEAQASLEAVLPLREQVLDELGQLLGGTPTPYPTLPQQGELPVTGVVQASPSISPTEPYLATMTNAQGTNLRYGPGLEYSFRYVLEQGTVAVILGTSEDHEWLLVAVPGDEQIFGWVYLPVVETNVDIDQLQVFTEATPEGGTPPEATPEG